MSAILVFQAGTELDLSPLTSLLWQEKIPHRVVIEGEQQSLYVSNIEDAEKVKTLLESWQQGQLPKAEQVSQPAWFRISQVLMFISQFPVVCLILLILSLVALSQLLGVSAHFWLMSSLESWQNADSSWQTLLAIEPWRIFSPTFLHFGWLHLLMNVFWWWILAREIERMDGSLTLLSLVVLFSIFVNSIYFLLKGPLFGGLSAVNYGLMAWVWYRQRRYFKIIWPRLKAQFKREGNDEDMTVEQKVADVIKQMPVVYQVPKWLFPFMMVWMALSFALEGLMSVPSNTGHEAHLLGAVVGLLFASVWPLNKKIIG